MSLTRSRRPQSSFGEPVGPAPAPASREAVSPERRRVVAALGAAGLLGASGGVLAQAAALPYPNRAVRFVVPFPPGSGTDTTARMFAKKIGEFTGQPVSVENRPGGNGFIGVQAALNPPNDGYTVFIGSNSTLSTNAATFKKLPYDPLTDITPISLLSRGPCLIIVPPKSPFQTLADLIAEARKRPGALNYATGSMSYTLYSEWLNDLAGMKTTGITYKGAGDAVNVTMAGTVDFAVVDASGANELVRGGRLRALAYTSRERSSVLPEVPSIVEAGVPDFLAENWVAAAVTSKAPAGVAERLAALFVQAGADPETKEFYRRQGSQLIVSPPAELRRYQEQEIARWSRLVKLTGIELQ
ncbi:MAG: tripartite tricarboxylate transporter substrate binding protein [Comamonadaceae bacterium]|nr:MAG: tripartite tricarboxylate transporter substrate binding protein [Comamonadaceae bacterium]